MAKHPRLLQLANDLLHATRHLALIIFVGINEFNDAPEQNAPQKSVLFGFDFDRVVNMSSELLDHAVRRDSDAQLRTRVVDSLSEIALPLHPCIDVLHEREGLLCPVLLSEGRQEPARFARLRLYRIPECKVLLLRVGTV